MSRSIVRAMFRAISILTPAFTFPFNYKPISASDPATHSTKKDDRHGGQIGFKTYANLSLGVGGDREARRRCSR